MGLAVLCTQWSTPAWRNSRSVRAKSNLAMTSGARAVSGGTTDNPLGVDCGMDSVLAVVGETDSVLGISGKTNSALGIGGACGPLGVDGEACGELVVGGKTDSALGISGKTDSALEIGGKTDSALGIGGANMILNIKMPMVGIIHLGNNCHNKCFKKID